MSTDRAGPPNQPADRNGNGPAGDSTFTQRLRAAREGSRDAFGELTNHYRNYLLVLAQQGIGEPLRSKVGASDLVQETFTNAQRKFDQFRGATRQEWLAWLQCILRTQLAAAVARYSEASKRDISREVSLDLQLWAGSAASLPGNGPSPEELARLGDETIEVQRALEQLSEDHRQVIVLRSIQERPFAEVAERMGRSVEAVKKLWSRAIDRLGEIMESDDDSRVS
jgi:RNA polymerase sigma-70 factor (ECF subfamily)